MAVATTTDTRRSQEMFRRISRSIAGGESSYARLRSGIELCIERSAGARMWDVDGNEYLDYCLGYGPLLFGHHPQDIVDAVVEQITERGFHFTFPHRLDYEVGERLQRLVPSMELIRFACSGTEATMAAMRLARGFTGKEKIVKFEGAYHGWSDLQYISAHPVIRAAGLHHAPRSLPDTPGTPKAFADAIIIQPFNDLDVLARTLHERAFEIAGVIIEPALANCGIIPPLPGFLEGVRRLTEETGAVLIFDEVMTGFRVAPGGAQERFGVRPDLSTFAKVLGGGFPVAAFGGRADIMELEATGAVMHGGTYTASPLVLAAAKAVLDRIERDRDTMYPKLEQMTTRLQDGLLAIVREAGYPALVQGVGPFFQLFFLDRPRERLIDYRDAMGHSRHDVYAAFHEAMQHRGIYFHPGQSERWFLSTEHTEQDIDQTLAAASEAIAEVARRLPPGRAAD